MKPLIESKVVFKNYLTDDLLIMGFEINMDYEAGQFFHIIIDKENPNNEKGNFRAYSILNCPSDAKKRNVIECLIKILPQGLGSEFIKSINVSDTVFVRGPYGRFNLQTVARSHIFFATGTGIAPIHSIITEYVGKNGEMTLLYSAKNMKELVFHEEFERLAENNKDFHYYPALTREDSQEWKGLKGRIQSHLHLIDMKNKSFYICGLKDFVSDIKQALFDNGVNSEDVVLERYD